MKAAALVVRHESLGRSPSPSSSVGGAPRPIAETAVEPMVTPLRQVATATGVPFTLG